MNQVATIGNLGSLPTLITASGDQAARRFLEFFTATIRNPHTRRAYGRACGEFLAWCADAGVRELVDVQPLHVATWIEMQARELAAPSVNPLINQTTRSDPIDRKAQFARRSPICPHVVGLIAAACPLALSEPLESAIWVGPIG